MRLVVLSLLTVCAAFGQYTYDYSSLPDPSMPDLSVWQPLGYADQISSPWNVYFDIGWLGGPGSFIYKPTITGANANDYEVSTTIGSYFGGTAQHILRANSYLSDYISVDITSYGFSVYHYVSGSPTTIGSTSGILISPGTTIRSIIFGTNLWVVINGQIVGTFTVPATTGQPGFGGKSGVVYFSNVKFGHHDTVAPSAPGVTGIRSSVLPTQVSLAWNTSVDDSTGIGVCEYQIARGSTSIGVTPQPEFTDSTVSPGTAYTYSVTASDCHGNLSAATTSSVTTPPSSSVDPRRTGIYSTGSLVAG